VRAAANLEEILAQLAALNTEGYLLPAKVEEEMWHCLSCLRDSLCGILALGGPKSPLGGMEPPSEAPSRSHLPTRRLDPCEVEPRGLI